MKWQLLGMSLVLLPVLSSTQQNPVLPVLTLDEAIHIAEQNAFTLRTAASSAERARQRINEARSALGPKITANANYSHAIDHSGLGSTSSGSTGGGTTGGGTGTTSGSFSGLDSQAASLQLNWPIDITGVARKGIAAVQNTYLASRANIAVADNDLRLTVKNNYFQILQAKAQVAVAQESLTNAQARLTNARQRLAAGALARLDVLQFEVQASQAQSDLIAAQNLLTIAKEAFNNSLARPIDSPFDVSDVTVLPALTQTPAELTGIALSQRPEIQALRANIQALKYTREAQEAGMYPSLAIGATHSRIFEPGTTNTAFNVTQGFLNLSVPIFDAGLTRARVKEARQDEAQAEIQYEQTQLGISLEVQQALSNLTNSRAQFDVTTAQVTQAQEAYRLSLVRFNAGEGTTLDVTNAQTNLTQAQTAHVNARYNYLRYYAALQRAIAMDAAKAPAVAAPQGSKPTEPKRNLTGTKPWLEGAKL